MSTSFTLGLDRRAEKLFQGVDKGSAFICEVLHRELGFPRLVRTGPASTAWTAKKPGVITTVRYANETLTKGFEELTGIAGRLLVSLDLDKQTSRAESISSIFSIAQSLLACTESDAAFCLEWDHVILRRIQGETFIEDISALFPRGHTGALLQQLDPAGNARSEFK